MRRPDPFPLRQAHARPLACFSAAFLLGLMAAKVRPLPLWFALAALAAGRSCFEIDRLARDYIDAQGYPGRFGHGLGHCVGLDIHEYPRLSQVSRDTLAAGMVITVEPGIYLPGVGGVRIEDTCLVKEQGAEALTGANRELIIL